MDCLKRSKWLSIAVLFLLLQVATQRCATAVRHLQRFVHDFRTNSANVGDQYLLLQQKWMCGHHICPFGEDQDLYFYSTHPHLNYASSAAKKLRPAPPLWATKAQKKKQQADLNLLDKWTCLPAPGLSFERTCLLRPDHPTIRRRQDMRPDEQFDDQITHSYTRSVHGNIRSNSVVESSNPWGLSKLDQREMQAQPTQQKARVNVPVNMSQYKPYQLGVDSKEYSHTLNPKPPLLSL